MENDQAQVNTSTDSSQNPPSRNPISNQRGNVPIILGTIVVLLVVGTGAYYLGTRQNLSEPPQQATTVQTSVQNSPSALPTQASNQNTSGIPSDWVYKTYADCNVRILLPPKKEPYYIPKNPAAPPSDTILDNGGFWHYQEGSQGEFSLGKNMFKYYVVAIYKNPEATSGYIAGMVEVLCSPNTQGYTTDTLLKKYESGFTDGTYQGFSLISKEEVKLWGRKVYKLKITGGMTAPSYDENNPGYLVATEKGVFNIRMTIHSSSPIIKETTQKIFDNLQFTSN